MPGLGFIQKQLKAVRGRIDATTGNVHFQTCIALNKLREDLIESSALEFSNYIRKSIPAVKDKSTIGDYPEHKGSALLVCDMLLGVCSEQLGVAPTRDKSDRTSSLAIDAVSPTNVFIVHGHDEANLLRLERLLEKRWGLKPSVLRDAASSGRTIIEKFEQHARDCGYAFILLTPDDQVSTSAGASFQARPNVIFELGWFYGRLGRDRVCILYKSGTSIHSDLAGVVRIEFSDSIEEKLGEIERELTAAGLL